MVFINKHHPYIEVLDFYFSPSLYQDTLRECPPDRPGSDYGCHAGLQFISPLYFVSFVLTAQFVLINVVVAVLMKHLDDSNKEAQEDAEMDAEIELELAQGGLCCMMGGIGAIAGATGAAATGGGVGNTASGGISAGSGLGLSGGGVVALRDGGGGGGGGAAHDGHAQHRYQHYSPAQVTPLHLFLVILPNFEPKLKVLY